MTFENKLKKKIEADDVELHFQEKQNQIKGE